MKSKYLNIQKLKQQYQHQESNKKYRKQTKPKKSIKIYQQQQKDTQSDNFKTSKRVKDQKNAKFFKKRSLKQQEISNAKIKHKRYSITQSSNSQPRIQKDFLKKQSNEEPFSKSYSKNPSFLYYNKSKSPNFIVQLNNYLHDLKRNKLNLVSPKDQCIRKRGEIKNNEQFMALRQKQKQKSLQKTVQLSKNLKKERSINRNLQKCIIEIQKVLWDRNDKLQQLENELKRQNEQESINNFKRINQGQNKNLSKTMFFDKKSFNDRRQNPLFHNQRSSQNKSFHNKLTLNKYNPTIYHQNFQVDELQNYIKNPLQNLSKIYSPHQQKYKRKLHRNNYNSQEQITSSNRIQENDNENVIKREFNQTKSKYDRNRQKQRNIRTKTQSQMNIEKILTKTLQNNEKQKNQQKNKFQRYNQNKKSYKRFHFFD